jgi:hypothetical protein
LGYPGTALFRKARGAFTLRRSLNALSDVPRIHRQDADTTSLELNYFPSGVLTSVPGGGVNSNSLAGMEAWFGFW